MNSAALLPSAERAVIDMAKLTGYALNPWHPAGSNKARVFAASLGLTAADARVLADQIRAGLRTTPARMLGADRFGMRFRVDVPMTGPRGRAIVATGWIIEHGEDVPRLTTLFVLRGEAI